MRLLVTKTATRQLKKLPVFFRDKVEARIEALRQNPFPKGVKKLRGRPGYRIRVGVYRVLYSLDQEQKIITILSAQHRKDAYRYN